MKWKMHLLMTNILIQTVFCKLKNTISSRQYHFKVEVLKSVISETQKKPNCKMKVRVNDKSLMDSIRRVILNDQIIHSQEWFSRSNYKIHIY